MRFHLNHTPQKPNFSISHHDHIILIGSCFSSNIGNLLHQYKFKTSINPGGILFNPLSISINLRAIMQQNKPEEKFVLKRDDRYYSYLHHSSLFSDIKENLLEEIKTTNTNSYTFLKNCDYLILTFGSAYYYHHLSLDSAVANCHKQPGKEFSKNLLGVSEIVKDYHSLLKDLKKINPNIKIIFTVSPVKHLKDGITENNLSKSTLILAVHELVSTNDYCFYFPAYELVNDDLRDYRFYKEDMAHPNDLAINYVWEKFSDWCFSAKTIELNHELHKLNLALNHRKMQENTSEAAKLSEFITKQKETVRKLHPGFDLE